MLGSMVDRIIESEHIATDRSFFDAKSPDKIYFNGRVINCIGVIKPHCGDVENAIRVNSLFPYMLPQESIQIATDCVFSCKKGNYVESDIHDATDVYGKTKSLGEAPHLNNLRCSIIGPETNNHLSLLDWFLNLKDEYANGFTNHFWNGITTYHFAKICQGIINDKIELPYLQHIVPADVVTKSELLKIIAEVYKKDIIIRDVEADEDVDRTLSTNNPSLNNLLWQSAGYSEPPTIKQMIQELAEL